MKYLGNHNFSIKAKALFIIVRIRFLSNVHPGRLIPSDGRMKSLVVNTTTVCVGSLPFQHDCFWRCCKWSSFHHQLSNGSILLWLNTDLQMRIKNMNCVTYVAPKNGASLCIQLSSSGSKFLGNRNSGLRGLRIHNVDQLLLRNYRSKIGKPKLCMIYCYTTNIIQFSSCLICAFVFINQKKKN